MLDLVAVGNKEKGRTNLQNATVMWHPSKGLVLYTSSPVTVNIANLNGLQKSLFPKSQQ